MLKVNLPVGVAVLMPSCRLTGEIGQGLERPFCVRFGPDEAMYIADFGQHVINLHHIADGHLPFEFVPKTGVIWKVTKTR